MVWIEPSLSLRWGPYTKLDGDEQGQIVTATIAAKKEGIITTRMAVEKIAPIFGIENVDAALEAILKEKAENAATALQIATAQTTAEQESLHRLAGGSDAKPQRDRSGSKKEPPSPSGSGSGGASDAAQGEG